MIKSTNLLVSKAVRNSILASAAFTTWNYLEENWHRIPNIQKLESGQNMERKGMSVFFFLFLSFLKCCYIQRSSWQLPPWQDNYKDFVHQSYHLIIEPKDQLQGSFIYLSLWWTWVNLITPRTATWLDWKHGICWYRSSWAARILMSIKKYTFSIQPVYGFLGNIHKPFIFWQYTV